MSLISTKKISPEFNRRTIIGYHGTSTKQAERAIQSKSMLLSDDPGDWLAKGAYFWENSLDMAQRWAKDRYGDDAAVVRAEIMLGRCLDLTDSKWSDALRSGHKDLAKAYAARGASLPRNEGYHRYLDYAVIDHLCETTFSVDTVRASFAEGEEAYEGGFRDLSHIQIAVRNPEMILSLEPSFPFPFKAYLASALTNLTEDQRREVDDVQAIVQDVCKSRGIDLYLPKDKTDPERHRDVSPERVFFSDIEEVLRSDLLILMADFPSFGGGMELKSALDALLPIIMISKETARVSRMVLGIPSSRSYHIKYKGHEDLKEELQRAISVLRQNMVDRKDNVKSNESSVRLGVKANRERLAISRGQLAASLGLSAEAIQRIEESPDYLTNPSLIFLRRLARALDVSVAHIVEPSYLDLVTREAIELFSENEPILRARQGKGQPSAKEYNNIIRLALQERLRGKRGTSSQESNP